MSLFASGADRAVIGFDAGWRATFIGEADGRPDRDRTLVLSRTGYEAEVRVSRSTNLRAATFELGIDGLRSEDLAAIIEDRLVFVEIALGWRDVASSGIGALGAGIAGLFDEAEGTLFPVIVGRIRDVQKTAGTFLERTTFRGVSAGFHRLDTAEAPRVELPTDETAPEHIGRIVDGLLDAVEVHTAGGLPGIDQPQDPAPGATALEAVRDIAGRGHAAGDSRELPVFFRVHVDADPVHEVLHVGHWDQPIGARHEIDASTGLAELRPVLDDRRGRGDPFEEVQPERLDWDLVLLGRADIQVGDVVTFAADELSGGSVLDSVIGTVKLGEVSVPGGGGPQWDVVSVEQAIGLETGFVTTLKVSPHPDTAEVDRRREASDAHEIAASVSAQRRAIEMRMWDVAGVSAQYADQREESGRTIHPQRRRLMSGLEDSSSPNRMVNAPLRETPMALQARPYLTPFAWGRAGLVLPHYPGTRVVDLHYRGLTQEGAIAGCVWEEGREPAAELGDWWLCLPVDVPEPNAVEDVASMEDASGDLLGAHDLVDGQGRRAIHVDGFRLTIGRGEMPAVGERPPEPPTTSLEIRHEQSNARIVIDDQGNIEIATDGDLTFRANKIEAHVDSTFEVL